MGFDRPAGHGGNAAGVWGGGATCLYFIVTPVAKISFGCVITVTDSDFVAPNRVHCCVITVIDSDFVAPDRVHGCVITVTDSGFVVVARPQAPSPGRDLCLVHLNLASKSW
jgi:hypothetical protein